MKDLLTVITGTAMVILAALGFIVLYALFMLALFSPLVLIVWLIVKAVS